MCHIISELKKKKNLIFAQSRPSEISNKKLLVNNIRESILKTYPEKRKR